MAAFNIQEALIWKDKIEFVIDQVCFLWLHSLFPLPSLPKTHNITKKEPNGKKKLKYLLSDLLIYAHKHFRWNCCFA